jgi:hypothetical protein
VSSLWDALIGVCVRIVVNFKQDNNG